MRPVILVVEEDEFVRNAVCHWISCMFPGGQLLAARNGREAMKCVSLRTPTIVLIDLRLCDIPASVAKTFIEAMSPATEVVLFSPEPSPDEFSGATENRNPNQRMAAFRGSYRPSVRDVCFN